MFENLSNRLQRVFSSLKKTGSIDETALDLAMRDIRRALLEADVSLEVVKKIYFRSKAESFRPRNYSINFTKSNDYQAC